MPAEYDEKEQLPWEEDGTRKRKNKTKHSKHKFLMGAIVAFLVIITVLPLVALISGSKSASGAPEVVSVEQLDSYPISNCEIEDEIMLVNYDDRLEMEFSNIDYKYKVTLSNGREFIMHPGSRTYEIGSCKAVLEINGYIYTNNLGEVIKKPDGTVDITISARIGNSTLKHNPAITEAEYTFKRKTVDCVVKSLEYKGKNPVEVYKDSDYKMIESGEFEITYGDGRKVTAKPQVSENGMYQTLDGHPINIFEYDGNDDGIDDSVGISILDLREFCEVEVKEKEFPFSAVELTDCTFDENYKITSISYTVTYKDGTTAEFNNQKSVSNAERNWVLRYLDSFSFPHNEGYYVIAEPSFVYSEKDIPAGADKYELSENAAINVKLSLGFISEEELITNKVFAAPENDCSCLCHNNNKTAKRFYETLKPIMEFFAMNEYCECGIYHYEISEF